jgi:hypothetical protein
MPKGNYNSSFLSSVSYLTQRTIHKDINMNKKLFTAKIMLFMLTLITKIFEYDII